MRQHSEEVTVSTREFLRTFATLTKRPRSSRYTIVNHGRPIGVFMPYEMQSQKLLLKKKQITLADLERVRFKSGKKNLSTSIDSIVYGV